MTTDQISRRRFIGGGAAGMLSFGLATSLADAATSTQGPTRTLKGAYGDVRVPAHPTRVVALSKAAVLTLLDVGITPVGIDDGEASVALPVYRTRVAKIPTVGSYGNFSLEKIAALKPDLIVSFDTYIPQKQYAQFSEVAPTFALETDSGVIGWKQATAAFADAVNRNGAQDALQHHYVKRLAQVHAAYAPVLKENRWEVAQAAQTGTFYRYLPSSDPSQILHGLGATLGDAGATGPNYWGPQRSYETIETQLGRATVILVVQVGEKPFVGAPTFKQLPAAKAGHVYSTNLLFPSSYSGALDLVDFIESVCRKLS